MARLIFADPGSTLVYRQSSSRLLSAVGQVATLYTDDTGTVLADIAAYDPSTPNTPGPVIAGSTLVVDSNSLLPWFWGPAAGDDTVWVVVAGGPITRIDAYYDPRIDASASAAALAAETAARISADNALSAAIVAGDAAVTAAAAADATAKANAAQAAAQASSIQTSLVDAKGDLLAGTANDAIARLPVGTAGYVPWADPAAATGIAWFPRDPNELAAGSAALDRRNPFTSTVGSASGNLRLTYFTASRAETIANIAMISGGTAAGATPTLVRMGVYSVAPNGDLTLVGACANDTTLFATQNTRYTRALTASYAAVAGQRYAFAVIVVTAAQTPSFWGIIPNAGAAASLALAPRVSGVFAGQTDLTTPIVAGSVASTVNIPYGEALP